MDQIKIGRFIAECRKKQNFTQMQLAERLGITDRAVSKWERGKGMPDSSIMLDLCRELKISINELLSGEVIEMTEYDKKAEQQLLEMAKQKEEADRQLLTTEIVIGTLSIVLFFMLIMIASFADMSAGARLWIIIPSTVFVVVLCLLLVRIEQVAGYYQCSKCGHIYTPTYSSTLWAMHYGRTRHMKCPVCGRKSWQKKVIKQ